jgi:hypothetical protein
MKSRLCAQPPGRASLELEVELPNDPGTAPIPLKCFSPPPNNQAEHIKWGATDEELGISRRPAPTPKKKKGLFGRLLG